MEEVNKRRLPYADVIVKLLQGAIYQEMNRAWESLLMNRLAINSYFEQIGLELIVEREDGYAFLRQVEGDEGKTVGLVRRMPLTYEQTLLCVLLREWMDEFEITDTENRNLYVSHRQICERIEIFFKDSPNQVRLLRNLDTLIRDMNDFDFLKRMGEATTLKEDNLYEVRRIIKSRITSDKLEEFKQKLISNVSV